jgi:predicted DNA binding protein
MEVVVKFITPVEWIRKAVKTHSARIKIRDIRISQEGVKDLVEIFSPEGKIEGLSAALYQNDLLEEEHLTITDDYHATAIVDAKECPICNTMHKWDLFLTEASSDADGNVIMQLLVPDEQTTSGFLQRLEADGIKFELIKKRNLSKKGDITARQEYVVKTALDLGFFDYPKKINLEGLSKKLNVSYVTLAEILRRAEKNIISSYFKKRDE